MKRAIIAGVGVLALATTSFARSSQTYSALGQLINEVVNAEISQTATVDVANGISRNAKRLGGATKADASAVGGYVFETTLQPTYEKVLLPTGNGFVKAKDWIVKEFSPSVSNAVTNVYYGLGFVAAATVGGVSATAEATKLDATAVGNAEVSQTATADVANGISDSNTVDVSGNSSEASKGFSSAPGQKVLDYKDQKRKEKRNRVQQVAREAYEAVGFYGADADQVTATLIAVGQYAAAEAGEYMSDEEAVAMGTLLVFGRAANM